MSLTFPVILAALKPIVQENRQMFSTCHGETDSHAGGLTSRQTQKEHCRDHRKVKQLELLQPFVLFGATL